MKTTLFCNLPYAFSILKPLADELEKQGDDFIWYVPTGIVDTFPYSAMPHTSSIKELEAFKSDAIFVPGNEVPYWLRGLKVQIFHGLAGEKKGHFRIRDYFDLYLTQGPYFTKKFQKLSQRYKNFDVIETGWCKLDTLYKINPETKKRKENLLKKYGAKYIVLYSPTFSPSLTSAKELKKTVEKLGTLTDILCIVKFHDKMDKAIQSEYSSLNHPKILIVKDSDITPSLQIADLMLSDTSSVVYEFILLNKPVVTLNSQSENITWSNHKDTKNLFEDIVKILKGTDDYAKRRQDTIMQYHPYSDGKSAQRMLEATATYIENHGVPKKRKLSLLRKWKVWKNYKHKGNRDLFKI